MNDYFDLKKFHYRWHRYHGASISKMNLPTESSVKLLEWIKKPRGFLFLYGSAGSGKTYAALATLAAITPTPGFCYFRPWTESEFFGKLKDGFELKGSTEELVQMIADDHLMFLDDLGSGAINEWRKEVIFDLVNTRYNRCLPTILTSNFTPSQIPDLYSARLASRLFGSDCLAIDFGDRDLRQEGY